MKDETKGILIVESEKMKQETKSKKEINQSAAKYITHETY